MRFFVLASLLALALAEPEPVQPMVHYGNGVVAPKKTPEVEMAEAAHFNAKHNAEMYKAQMPYVYQTPYVYTQPQVVPKVVKPVEYKVQTPVVYAQPQVVKPVVYTKPVEVQAPVTYTHATPVTYTHSVASPVTYTTHHQSMVYQHTTPYGYHYLNKRDAEADPQVFYNTYGYYPTAYTGYTGYTGFNNFYGYPGFNNYYGYPATYTHHSLYKRDAEAEADPQVFYNTHGYYPSWYTHQVAPVVYTQPKVQKVEYKTVKTPVTYTAPVAPVVTKTVSPVTYTAPAVPTVAYTMPHHQYAYNYGYPYTFNHAYQYVKAF